MFATKVVVLVASIATTALIARELGPSGRGELAVAISFVQLLAQFGMLGLPTANPYYVSREPHLRRQIAWNSIWLSLIVGAALATMGVALNLAAPEVTSGIDWTELLVALAGIPAILAGQFAHSILLGEGRNRAYNLSELGITLATLIILAFGFIAFDLGVLGTLIILIGSRIVSALVVLLVVVAPDRRPHALDRELINRMFRYGARIYLATLLGFLVIRIDLLLVNGYLGATEAGLYSVVVALADGMYLLPTVVAVNLFARVARGLGSDASAQVFRMLAIVYGAICLVAIPLAGVGIEVLFGPEFEDATELFYWLLPGIFCLGMLNVLSQHFAGKGFPLEAALVWGVGLAIDLVIILIFMPANGTYVAALASSVAYTCLLLLHVRMFAKEVGGYALLIPRMTDLRSLWVRSPRSEPT